MRILGQLVARNEADRYLIPVLERLKGQVDDIIFTDDCSTDNTADIAESFGAKVMQMPEPTFTTNESKLRTAAWHHLEQFADPKDTWVLAIDADELLYETRHSLRWISENIGLSVVNIMFYHMWSETHFRHDKAWRPHGSFRLFRYQEKGVFLPHNLACGSEPTYVRDWIKQGNFYTESGLAMKHLSYIKDEHKQEKYDRYAKIDGGQFHANDHIESILDKEFLLAPFNVHVRELNAI